MSTYVLGAAVICTMCNFYLFYLFWSSCERETKLRNELDEKDKIIRSLKTNSNSVKSKR